MRPTNSAPRSSGIAIGIEDDLAPGAPGVERETRVSGGRIGAARATVSASFGVAQLGDPDGGSLEPAQQLLDRARAVHGAAHTDADSPSTSCSSEAGSRREDSRRASLRTTDMYIHITHSFGPPR